MTIRTTLRATLLRCRTRIGLMAPLVGLSVVCGLGGCTMGKGIKFTNVSDTWLDVRYFVGPKVEESDGTTDLYWKRTQQVKPGQTARFTPPNSLVHIRVETVTPSWEPASQSYWLELLTSPPVHIVATGRGDKLDFKTGSGEVAIIPERELTSGRYEYLLKEPPPTPQTPPSAIEPAPTDLVGPASP